MFDDVRYGWRKLRQEPSFTAIAVLTLALGIGATSAVFSLVQGVLLTPPPYRDPEQLVLVQRARTDGQPGPPQRWSAAQWLEWQRDSKSFEAMAGYAWSFNFLVSDEGSESLEGMFVSTDFFKVLGLEPLLGRTFQESETAFPAGQVIILGYDVWQRKFGGDPKIIGTTGSDQPPADAADGDRRDAARHPVPALADDGAGTELQRQCAGGFLDAGGAESGAAEAAESGMSSAGCAAARPSTRHGPS